jgi:dihydropyrimidinase
LLDRTALEETHGERLVCSPPLRSLADRRALWSSLATGDVAVLSTDHCPFTAAEKAAGHTDFTTIPGGLPSVEARISLAYAFGRRHGLTLPHWIDTCCASPARIFGLTSKGRVEVGFDADLIVFNPGRTVEIRAGETLHERVDWSPYEGIQVQGWPRDVLSRGRVVVREGAFVGEAGWGRFVRRSSHSLPVQT